MTIVESLDRKDRWTRKFHGLHTFSDDLGAIGTWVAPRSGPHRRTAGQREDYVLRRLLVAWKQEQELQFPFSVSARVDDEGLADFLVILSDGSSFGIEVTEAGDERYQRWLTWTARQGDVAELLPDEYGGGGWTDRAVKDYAKAIRDKVQKYDHGSYREADRCDLAIYDNTATGGFVDVQPILSRLAAHQELTGRFSRIHFVRDSWVALDALGNRRQAVDISADYDISFAEWAFRQADQLRKRRSEFFDVDNLAEEIESLGRNQRSALRSHLRNLLLHLLKWQFQPERRSRSWLNSIVNARQALDDLIADSPSLGPFLKEVLDKEFSKARQQALVQTGLPEDRIPHELPFDLKQIQDDSFPPIDEADG